MGSVDVVMAAIAGQQSVAWVSLRISTWSHSSWRGLDDVDLFGLEDGIEGGGVLAVAVAPQEPQRPAACAASKLDWSADLRFLGTV